MVFLMNLPLTWVLSLKTQYGGAFAKISRLSSEFRNPISSAAQGEWSVLYALDFDRDRVTVLQKDRRIAGLAHAIGCAGQDDVAGFERGDL